ncbi:hypothetical protein F443_08086 [Phytophthora nicotianae P1569]|uniref:SAP domain-containing protein n=1 Tax=Phytophthora nicotianae P1569 TaxID=1317065 RepID=V9FBM9_PHYNI|nr:hypothetical protein F443_08086 [Phytophthora nicotianae P1569]
MPLHSEFSLQKEACRHAQAREVLNKGAPSKKKRSKVASMTCQAAASATPTTDNASSFSLDVPVTSAAPINHEQDVTASLSSSTCSIPAFAADKQSGPTQHAMTDFSETGSTLNRAPVQPARRGAAPLTADTAADQSSGDLLHNSFVSEMRMLRPATGQIMRGGYTNDELLGMLSSDEESELFVPATGIRAHSMARSVVPPTTNDYGKWTVVQLRKECTERKLRLKRTVSKPDQIRHLTEYDAAKRAVQSSVDEENLLDPSQRKKKHCPIRLLNVLFSDQFAGRLGASDDAATREQLDAGEVNAKTKFWQDVGDEFWNNTSDFNNICDDAASNPRFATIDPSVIVQHDSAKLFELWKMINRSYVKANSKFYVSGQNSDDFFAYCEGNLGALYLRICTKIKPELAAFVYGGMCADDEIDSMNLGENRARTPGHKSVKWQDQVIKTINRMTDFIVGAPLPASTAPQKATGGGDNEDQLIDRISKLHQMIDQVKNNLRKSEQEGIADTGLAKTLRMYQSSQQRYEEQLEALD